MVSDPYAETRGLAERVLSSLDEAPGLPGWTSVLFLPATVAFHPSGIRIPANRLVPLFGLRRGRPVVQGLDATRGRQLAEEDVRQGGDHMEVLAHG